MAESTNSKIGKRYAPISSVTVAPIKFSSQDIATWKQAIDAARNRDNPRRRMLYELYANVLIDGKLTTCVGKREAGVSNKKFVFYQKGTKGTPVKRIMEEIIETTWFDNLKKYAGVQKKLYGHSLIELVPGVLPIDNVVLIPHANVVPERGELLLNYMDSTGLPYRGENADPQLKKFLIEAGEPKDYGLLMVLSQYVIYKRGGYGDWAQFAELFGMPFRVGKYDPFDDKTRQMLLTALANMGGAGYAAIPMGTEISFENANYGSGQSGIFKDLVQMCNDEIAQVMLGGTMTTDNGSSHSQSETHAEGEHDITRADLHELLNWMNGPFKKKLVEFGYSEALTGYFDVESTEVISLLDRIEIDKLVAQEVKIDPEYWYEKYSIPVPKTGAEAIIKPAGVEDPANPKNPDPANPKNPDPAKPEKKKIKLSLRLNSFYKMHTCGLCNPDIESLKLAASTDKEIELLAQQIIDGKIKPGSVDKDLVKKTAAKLMEGITKGLSENKDPDATKFLVQDDTLLAAVRENVFIFSGFKTEKMLREASALLLDNEGNIRSKSDFIGELLKLDATYNVQHLAAEYDHALASGQMISKWQTFKDLNEDFPNLMYTTAGDDRVRPTHAILDGAIRPMNDPFWNTNYPPNGWRCRCDVDATDQEANDKGGSGGDHGKMFNHNVGKDGVVFPESHPYFEASEAARKKVTAVSKSVM